MRRWNRSFNSDERVLIYFCISGFIDHLISSKSFSIQYILEPHNSRSCIVRTIAYTYSTRTSNCQKFCETVVVEAPVQFSICVQHFQFSSHSAVSDDRGCLLRSVARVCFPFQQFSFQYRRCSTFSVQFTIAVTAVLDEGSAIIGDSRSCIVCTIPYVQNSYIVLPKFCETVVQAAVQFSIGFQHFRFSSQSAVSDRGYFRQEFLCPLVARVRLPFWGIVRTIVPDVKCRKFCEASLQAVQFSIGVQCCQFISQSAVWATRGWHKPHNVSYHQVKWDLLYG